MRHDSKETARKKHDGDPIRNIRAIGSVVQDNLSTLAHDAGAQVSELLDTGREKFYDARDEYLDRIREKPVQTGLITLGVGLLLGLLLRRR